MAKLPIATTEIIWSLKRRLLDTIDQATAAEAMLFDLIGETDGTVPFPDELKKVAERATPWFSRLSNFQLRIAEAQPTTPFDMLNLLSQTVERIQAEVPAMERSVQEVKMEWNLP